MTDLRIFDPQQVRRIVEDLERKISEKNQRINEIGEENANLKRQVTNFNRALRKKNLALDALHWVWCSGGCEGGAHRFTEEPLTEEIVALAERNTRRLREYLQNRQSRIKNDADRKRV